MYLYFKTLTFRNILSYGNKDSVIHFQEGLNLIVGKNGRGKSTMTDALCFCLYGKPYREIPIPKLVNNKNKKGLRVEVSFRKDADEYTITRTIKPDSIRITKNGDEQKLESHKSLIQETIDSILGVNYSLFKQIISLSSLYNKPFIDLDAKEKRDTLESIFNLKAFSIMAKNLKKTANIVKGDLEIKEREIVILKDSTISLVNQLKDLETQEEVKRIANQAKIESLRNEIVSTEVRIAETTAEIENLKSKEIEIPVVDDSKKMELVAQISSLKSEIQTIEKQIAKVEAGDLKEFGIDVLIEPFVKEEQTENARVVAEEGNLNIRISECKNQEDNIREKFKDYSVLLEAEIKNNSLEKIIANEPRCQELSKRYAIILSQIAENKKKIEKMDKVGGICSQCFQTVDEKHKEKEIEILKNEIFGLEDELLENCNTKADLSNTIRTLKNNEIQNRKDDYQKIYDEKLGKVLDESIVLKRTLLDSMKNLRYFKNEIAEKVSAVVVEKKNEILVQLKSNLTLKNISIFRNDESLSCILGEEEKVKVLREEKERVSRLVNEARNRLSVLENSLKLKTEQAKEMTEYVPTSFDNLKKDIEIKKSYGKKLNDEIKSLREKTKIYEIIKSILDDEGMKRFFFVRLLPKLNQLINNYLDFFELPIKFSFNDTFEESLTDLAGEEYVFNSFSAGEQFRINLSITLSFIELNKMLNSFNCNIQFFDEIFDSGVDSDGMDLVLEKIKDMCDRAKTASYIISHREIDDSVNIDRIIKVEKKEGFSLITT